MKKILVTRRLLRSNEDRIKELYDANFVSGAVEQVSYTYRKLGGDVLDVEITEQKNRLFKGHVIHKGGKEEFVGVIKSDHIYMKGGDLIWIGHMYNYTNVIKEDIFVDKLTKYHPNVINNYPNFSRSMEKWIKLSLKRHQEFQDKLKIKVKIDLNSERFDLSQNLEDLKNDFYSSNFENEEDRNLEKEQKAKEEKEKKAKQQKEKKAKEEKERKAKEQKAKEEKSKAEDEISVDDLMSKIKELNEMFKSGLISKEEFEMLKKKLLKN